MPTGRRSGRPAEAGYTLAMVIGILTVMAIAVAAVIPSWAAAAEREREEELIARGFQYAEAIRVFRGRFGRLPNRLDELVENEPRSIRQLWDDPMIDGGWLVILEGPGGQLVTLDPASGELIAPAGSAGSDSSGAETGPGRSTTQRGASAPAASSSPVAVAGPIHGVKSRVHNDAYHKLFDRQDVGEWEFTVERLDAATGALAPDGLPRRAPASVIGRPFRYPPPGGVPGTVVKVQPSNRRQQGEQRPQRPTSRPQSRPNRKNSG